jgi:hypothetical protein
MSGMNMDATVKLSIGDFNVVTNIKNSTRGNTKKTGKTLVRPTTRRVDLLPADSLQILLKRAAEQRAAEQRAAKQRAAEQLSADLYPQATAGQQAALADVLAEIAEKQAARIARSQTPEERVAAQIAADLAEREEAEFIEMIAGQSGPFGIAQFAADAAEKRKADAEAFASLLRGS